MAGIVKRRDRIVGSGRDGRGGRAVSDEVAEKAGRKAAKRKPRGKPFQPGQSGNPNGKRPGTRHKATILAQALVDGQVEALVNKGLELALSGDVTMLRTMLGFILPARKDRYVAMELPTLRSAEDALEASRLVVAAIADGRLTPGEGGNSRGRSRLR
jgi:hypothetical protein